MRHREFFAGMIKRYISKVFIASLFVGSICAAENSSEQTNLCRMAGVKVEDKNSGIKEGKAGYVTNVIDGNKATYWFASGRKCDLLTIFPEPVTVSQSYWFHAILPGGRIDERGLKDYNIKTSMDGEKWQDAASVRNYKGGAKHDNFSPRQAKYVKLEILNSQGFLYPVLCEVELYEKPVPITEDELQWLCGISMPDARQLTLPVAVTTDKMLYGIGDDVAINIAIENKRARDGSFVIKLFHSSGLSSPELLMEKKVLLKTSRSVSLEYVIRKIREEYGHYVSVAVMEDGKETGGADCVFEATGHWAKISRYRMDPGEKHVPGMPADEISLNAVMMRKVYINSDEMFGQHVYFSGHFTDRDEWRAPYLDASELPSRSANVTIEWGAALEKNGIKYVGYTEAGALSPELEFAETHPEWIIHGPLKMPEELRKLYSLGAYFENLGAAPFTPGKPITAPDLHYNNAGDMYAMTDYLADDIARACKRFGWRGMFFDSIAWALEDSAFGQNYKGAPMNSVSPDEIGARFLARIKEEVKKATGREFVSVCNFGVTAGTSPWQEANLDVEKFRKEGAVYKKTLAEMGILFLEQHAVPAMEAKDKWGRYIYPQTIEDTVRALRLVREANDVNVPVMLYPLQYICGFNRSVSDTHFLFAGAYAAGVLLCATVSGTPPRYSLLTEPLAQNPLWAEQANYNKFAARYGEYLFDLNNRWLAKGIVECEAPENIWWKDLVSFRKYADGRMNIYVHLINRPFAPMTWGKKTFLPEPVANMPVTVKPPPGMRLAAVRAVSPNGSHEPQTLEYQKLDNGSVRVVVPLLKCWTMLVLSCEPQN